MSIDAVRDALRTSGLSAALRLLNDRVPHRFTAVYQLNGELMRNIAIVDKAGKVIADDLLTVPLALSFCQFVLRDGLFRLEGNADDRLEGHPYRGVVQSYVGVPLTLDAGLVGTFCHFDFPPMALADEEFSFMEEVAVELPPYLSRPGARSGSGTDSIRPHMRQQLPKG
ncbi:MAG: GAF domain-containing protein [Pseudomonadota bacterium]